MIAVIGDLQRAVVARGGPAPWQLGEEELASGEPLGGKTAHATAASARSMWQRVFRAASQ